MHIARPLFLAGAGAIAASSIAEPAMAQTHPAAAGIAAALATFGDALKRGDGSAAASIFTSDAILVIPGNFIRGRDAIAALFSNRLQTRKYTAAAFSTVSLTGSGDIAVEIGTNRVTYSESGQPPKTVLGRYLTSWRKGSDGVWRVEADAPMTDPAAPA